MEGWGGGGGMQVSRRMGASCVFAWLLHRKPHLHQGMKSTRPADPYGYRPKKKPSAPAAEIKGLSTMSRGFAYEDEYLSWSIFINIPLHTKKHPRSAHMNVLHRCAVCCNLGSTRNETLQLGRLESQGVIYKCAIPWCEAQWGGGAWVFSSPILYVTWQIEKSRCDLWGNKRGREGAG